MIRRLIVPLTVAIATFHAGQGFAQGAFPAPLPGRAAAAASDPAFPPVNGMAPTPSFGAAPSSFPATGAAPELTPLITALRSALCKRPIMLRRNTWLNRS